MIIIILGGIGSGKTLFTVREIAQSSNYFYTNFKLKNFKYHRLKYSDIVETAEDDKKKKLRNVNWSFWENERKKHKNFSIALDEVHNIIHARRSMTKDNILMSRWVSQIRKILSDSPNNHLYLISQTMRKIDVDFRELAQIIIYCQKYELAGRTIIKLFYYNGIEDWEINKISFKSFFIGDKFFNYYDSYEMVSFTDGAEYI